MGVCKALIGVDWGTHSSKWVWKTEQDGQITEGQFKILRSDVVLEDGCISLRDDEPPADSTFASSIKRQLIQNPDAPFWAAKQRRIGLSLGEIAAFSLWQLMSEAYADLVSKVTATTEEVDIRFALPNWIEGAESAAARACYEQAARVACRLFSAQRRAWSEVPRPSRENWRSTVDEVRKALEISDDTAVDYGQDGFRRVLEKSYEGGGGATFRFVAESSAAGLTGLRRSGEETPGYLRKILVVDVGAGSADIGYVLRSVNPEEKEALCQLPPANTCQIAGDDLTRRIGGVLTARGRRITTREAEQRKTLGPVEEWIDNPTVNEWIMAIASHVRDYVANIPDASWLPGAPGLQVLVTGGSAVVRGLREKVTEVAKESLRARGFSGSVVEATDLMMLHLPPPYDRDADRLAVSLGAASEELPLLGYFRQLERRVSRPIRFVPRSWSG